MTETSQNPSDDKSSEQPPRKKPEFIIIDDRHPQHGGPHPEDYPKGDHPFTKEEKEIPAQNSASLRIWCLMGFVFCMVFSAGMLIWLLIFGFLAAVILFQSKRLNQMVVTFWNLYTNSSVALLGFGIGIISPSLGLGLLLLYFSIQQQKMDPEFFKQILKRTFKND